MIFAYVCGRDADEQLESILDYADSHIYVLQQLYQETDEIGRPVLDKMMDDMASQELPTVLIAGMDAIARSSVVSAALRLYIPAKGIVLTDVTTGDVFVAGFQSILEPPFPANVTFEGPSIPKNLKKRVRPNQYKKKTDPKYDKAKLVALIKVARDMPGKRWDGKKTLAEVLEEVKASGLKNQKGKEFDHRSLQHFIGNHCR